MISDNVLKQGGGDNSSNLQAQTVNIHNGLSYVDVRQITMDVFQSNFLELSNKAASIAKKRAEELIDSFLKRVQSENSSALENVQDPDIQFAIFNAQKAYARSGEKDLEEILVSILNERVKENSKSLRKIILNGALETVPKLTEQQLDILTLIFLVQEGKPPSIDSKKDLKVYVETWFAPFFKSLTKDRYYYQHLEFTGCCGTIGLPEDRLSLYFISRYRGLFSKGFTREEFNSAALENSGLERLLVKKDINGLFQFDVVTEEELQNFVINTLKKDMQYYYKINRLFRDSTIKEEEADNALKEIIPGIEYFMEVWKQSYMCVMSLTSIGIALACLNFKKKTGIDLNLNNWIK